ncbi:MAG TPA: hypothetical protein DCO68_03225 [Methylophilaceae bacterium]|nr:hypothetical protein [Methylophilaceae bacterium]HAJ71069.1 hypothetical protein [Methylophilaceae bacterium]
MLFNKSVHQWRQWFRVSQTIHSVAVLNARQIYIVPTRWGLLYGIMLFALLVGAINYALSLAYFVTFLLASLANVAILHTWRNLAYLQVAVLNTQPVFAGDIAEVSLQLTETKNRTRYAIAAQLIDNPASTQEIQANSSALVTIPLTTHQRGYLTLPRIKLSTEFPLSLFHAWAVVSHTMSILVYPKPSTQNLPMPSVLDVHAKGNRLAQTGNEDFIGHKNYQIGDLPSQIDWKASSRGIGMFTKHYSGEAASTIHLDWSSTTGDKETRISQLTRWVMDAHSAQLNYGLTLHNAQLQPNHTEAHYHACLKALATL